MRFPFRIIVASIISLSCCFISNSAELVFAGDAMMHKKQLEAAQQRNGTYDYTPYFETFTPYISSADFAVINLETSLGGAPYSGYPCFCTPDSYLTAIKNAGFDMCLLANNHILDRRDKGLVRTVSVLEKEKMPFIGAYADKAQRNRILPFIKSIDGIKVAFLNYTYGTNGIKIQNSAVVDYIERNKIRSDINAARAQGAELICVCIHWGTEYQLLPDQSQRSMATFLLNQGVDIIIGGHPHVIQPMEIHRSPGAHNQLLVYSLGNFISAMRDKDCRGGAMVRVTIGRNAQGKAEVKSANYRLVFVQWPDAKSKNFRLVEPSAASSGLQQSAKVFENSAMRIFNGYNINVPRDTTPLHNYKYKKHSRQPATAIPYQFVGITL